MIKAIETEYKGYKFRSRLEARWAVLFDQLDIRYEYEPTGFEMRNKTRYLPDFYLPDFDLYGEMKPPREGILKELEKVSQFVTEDMSKRVLILGNIPLVEDDSWFHVPVVYYNPLFSTTKVGWLVIGIKDNVGKIFYGTFADRLLERAFDEVRKNDWFESTSSTDMKRSFWKAMAEEEYRTAFDIPIGVTKEQFERDGKRLAQAFKIARLARFEFGETPEAY